AAAPRRPWEVANSGRDPRQNRRGLRPASEARAAARVRGTIVRYEPDLPVQYNAQENRTVSVTKRLVQITVSVAIMDQRQGKPIWERSGLVVEGDYDPGQEAAGRPRGPDKPVTHNVEGAQQPW